MKKVLTTCGYCGCGCNLYLTVEGGRITGVLPKPDHPVSQGMLCSKGWQGHGFARHPDRLDQPLLRQEDGRLKGVSWSEAYRAIAEHYQKALRPGGALALEIGWQQREAVTALLAANGGTEIVCRKDFGGNDRCVMARKQ